MILANFILEYKFFNNNNNIPVYFEINFPNAIRQASSLMETSKINLS